MSEKQRCCAMVYSNGSSFIRYPCSKNASVERDGKHYCGIHDPVRKKEREDKNRAERSPKWDARDKLQEKERAEAAEQKRRAECFPDLLEALKGLIRHIGPVATYQDMPELNAARSAITKAGGEV